MPTYLQSHNNRIQVQNRFPILSQNIQTHVPLQINIGMIDLLRAFDLGRVMREILVDGKSKVKRSGLVETLVRLDRKREVENIIGIGEFGAHGAS